MRSAVTFNSTTRALRINSASAVGINCPRRTGCVSCRVEVALANRLRKLPGGGSIGEPAA